MRNTNRIITALLAMLFCFTCKSNQPAYATYAPTLNAPASSIGVGSTKSNISQLITLPFADQNTLMAAQAKSSAKPAESDTTPDSETADGTDPVNETTDTNIVITPRGAESSTPPEVDDVNIDTPAETTDSTEANATESMTASAEADTTEPAPAIPAEEAKLIEAVLFDAETQRTMYEDVCGGNAKEFALMMSIADNESDYNPNKVGDHGQSLGAFQIRTVCHEERLKRLGFSHDDLFDPVKCCIAGLDYIHELMTRLDISEPCHLLCMAYNMGEGGAKNAYRNGRTSTVYSEDVMPRYEAYLAELQAGGIV